MPKHTMKLWIATWLALVFALATGCSTAGGTAAAKVEKEAAWQFHDIAGIELIQKNAVVPQPEQVLLVDSRPYKPKYVNGHIPTAISMPFSQFDKMTDKLPQDKNAQLIFYCEGPTWKLSHKAAWKAEKIGYTNVKVFSAGYPAWIKARGSYAAVDVEYVAKQIAGNKAIVVDSRPKKAKYDKSHIPSAISIPHSKFDDLQGKLPRDLDTVLIFYCGGYTWKLSHNSARRAVALGYKNIKVFAAGYPAWKKYAGGATAAMPIKKGVEEGSIAIDQFKDIIENRPASIFLVDVRDKDEYDKGHFKTAVNIPVDELEKKVKSLPAGKSIVFVCSTGARSGESFYMLQDMRPELKKVYYLEAGCTYKKNGAYEIKKTE